MMNCSFGSSVEGIIKPHIRCSPTVHMTIKTTMTRSDLKSNTRNSKILIAAFFSLSCLLSYSTASAEDAFICPTENEKECAFENESMSLFIRGRDAYDHGREIGDLSEARIIGTQLVERKNKNGKQLLKMVYMSVRMGGHKNNVEAYHWVEESIARKEEYARLDMNALLETLSQRMTPDEQAKVKSNQLK